MFDVSFSELVLILVVGLLVFGPEKLPEVVRTASLWIGKIRRSFSQMRTEIEREMGVDDIKRDLHNNAIMQNLKDVHNDLRNTQRELQNLPYDVSDIVQRANADRNADTAGDGETAIPAAADEIPAQVTAARLAANHKATAESAATAAHSTTADSPPRPDDQPAQK